MVIRPRQPARLRLRAHVHGYPYDPPRWGEEPRLRTKKDMSEGAGTTVAVLDSGVARHPWLAGSLAGPIGPDALDIWDLSSIALPAHVGHGTHVAGVVLQYAPRATLVPRRVIDLNGSANDTDLAAVIESLHEVSPDVLNLSLGPAARPEPGTVDEGTERTKAAIRDLQDSCGTVVVVAAGNSRERFPEEHLAPEDELTVVVGALDLGGQPAWFSSRDHVQIWAPGVDVLSSFLYWDGPTTVEDEAAEDRPHTHGEQAHGGPAALAPRHRGPDHDHDHHEHDPLPGPPRMRWPAAPFAGWARWNGTSFATPAVAGAIAAEISSLGHVENVVERRRRGLERVMAAARDITVDKSGKGKALVATPVALEGPPRYADATD